MPIADPLIITRGLRSSAASVRESKSVPGTRLSTIRRRAPDVQRGASETGSASSQVLSAAQMLSRDSNRLRLEVGKFLNSVRAA